jgi:hypothetical protein
LKGYISVEIPTKKYIKAYLIARMGSHPYMNQDTSIGNKLYDLLQHQTNEYKGRFSNKRYNATVKIYIACSVFNHRGCFLNETNIKNFNTFIEKEIKRDYRMYMDFYIDILPSFEGNLPQVRKKIGIDLEDWSDDSIKKDYYRYRKATGLPLLYRNNPAATVPQNIYPTFRA